MSYRYPLYRLAVMTKSPQLGQVKTRMQPRHSPEFSRRLQLALTDYCLSQWLSAKICPLTLWIGGAPRVFHASLSGYAQLPWLPQVGTDLGERMQHAVQVGLAQAEAIVLVGTDCPFIDLDYLEACCHALSTTDVVVGPATDGGYVLLALKRVHAPLFCGIPWGANSVLAKTLERIAQLNLQVVILPTLSDIDRPEDLPQLAAIPAFDAFSQ